MEPSGVVFVAVKFGFFYISILLASFFWNNHAENKDSPKLVEIISLNLKVSIGDLFQAFLS
jgi:hypothetical protein